ncbi:hypothetical protein [Haloprofundus halobius]|uniref:hypothetical protein n=1 Tax=Haloprofundus halobius TaxID=2876194 RepID=UPI001CC96393|nr:hypothetical protein [Haloprofundus halobius]
MSPTRRTVLKAGGALTIAALAGCTSDAKMLGSGGSGESSAGDDTPGDSENDSGLPSGNDSDAAGGTQPEGTGGPGITICAVDEAPELPVAPSVEATESVATDEHPPQLRVTVTNESDRTVRIGEGREVFFEYVSDDDGHLTLLPADGEYDAEPGCWRLNEPIAITQEYRVIELEAGESTERLVDLYGAADGDGCLAVGEFRFEAQYSVLSESMESEQRATWGFSLRLE